MTASVPFRDTFWNVPVWAQVALYVGAVVAVTVFVYGLAQRVRLWRGGRPEHRVDRIPERIALVLKHALGQARTLSQAYPGVMHAMVFWGFLALFMGTVLATIDYDITLPFFDYKLLRGPFYLAYEAVLDLFGLFFVLGLGMALWRRFVLRPDRIDPTARFAGLLALLLVINVTGFVMEACRLAAVRPAWAPWSPVGWALGQGMLAAGMSESALRATHLSVWLFHAAVSLAFVAIVPYSYFVHLLTTPLNLLREARPAGRDPGDREPRGGREPRRLEARGVLVEAAARLRRLRRVRALPGRVPSAHGGHGALAQAGYRQAQAPHARRAAGADPRRADPARGAVGVHDVHGVRGGVPGVHRHRGHDHRPPALPRAVGGRAPVHGAAVAPEHPARGQPVGAPCGRATRVGPRARRAGHGARQGGGVPLLGGLLGVVRQAQPGDRPGGGEDPQGGGGELWRHAGGAVPRRSRPAARRGVSLPDAPAGEYQGDQPVP